LVSFITARKSLIRGFADQSAVLRCLLLGEEVGELFKAVRTRERLKVDVPGSNIGSELADILIYLCAIANRYDIDLEAAFRTKEDMNKTRGWS
jgi:NTP pyrophosphatase (non-canonical NTP hydrolase)|tara:strand:- start:849 stop:1127 length:279 start_codon:yes stop_codon:yes gene_type:complete